MCSTTTEVQCIGALNPVKIDSCIADIKALNDAGIRTGGSCCGHGKRPGMIFLEGRTIYIKNMDNDEDEDNGEFA